MGKFGNGGSTRLISNGRANATFNTDYNSNHHLLLWRLGCRVPILSFGEICYAR